MPYNVTIDDISPLITYTGQWRDAFNFSGDPFTSRYAGNSFHSSRTTGSQASFRFNGTSVYIFGAKRGNHGRYSVKLDNEQPQEFDGYAPIQPDGTDGIYQVPLYARAGLTDGLHNITLTNDGETKSAQPFVDIDFVIWTSNDETGSIETRDDGEFEYKPSGAWSTSSQYIENYYGKTGHMTSQHGASASLAFEGSGIYLYGGTLYDRGVYTINLDDHSPVVLNGFTNDFHPKNLLYYADGLGPGVHKLTVTNSDPQGRYFEVDYVDIIRPPSVSTGNSAGRPSAAVVAGIVCSVIIVIILMALVIWYIWRRNRLVPEAADHLDAKCEPYSLPPVSYGHIYGRFERINSNPSNSSLSLDSKPHTVTHHQHSNTSRVSLPDACAAPITSQTNAKGRRTVTRGIEIRRGRNGNESRETGAQTPVRFQVQSDTSRINDQRPAISPPDYYQVSMS
ncbi:hypothetical protein FS749_005972 [Ceratobasidium sp. UAMH 11750]|nr:hypothetical protein FS749_005972 [Ceratobasidium sp. UAMH 11750]